MWSGSGREEEGGETEEEWTIYGFFLPLPLLPLMLDEKSAARSDTEEERAHMSFLPSSFPVDSFWRLYVTAPCSGVVWRGEGEDGSVAEGQTMKPDRCLLLALSFDKLVSSSSWGAASFQGQQMQLGREGG